MKSAYEIAMERMEAESGPTKKLDDSQREQLTEIAKKYDAQAAELKLNYEQKVAAVNPLEQGPVQEQMAAELARIEERREAEKDKVWSASE